MLSRLIIPPIDEDFSEQATPIDEMTTNADEPAIDEEKEGLGAADDESIFGNEMSSYNTNLAINSRPVQAKIRSMLLKNFV